MNGLIESHVCALYQSFLYPTSMITRPEPIPNLDIDAQKFVMTEDLKFLPLDREGDKIDPVYRFFVPPSNSKHG